MSRYDPDLLAALAEGRLDPEEAARVEREIADHPATLAELEAQRAALAALTEAPTIQLSELERADLRATVADALGLIAPETVSPDGAPRRRPWGAIAVAGAALVGLIAVVPVVGLLNTGNDADSANTSLARAAVATSGADSEDADAAEAPSAEALEDDQFGAQEDRGLVQGDEAPGGDLGAFGSSSTVVQVAPATTEAAETTTTTSDATSETTTTSQPGPDAETQEMIEAITLLREDREALTEMIAEPTEETACWQQDTEYRGGEDPGGRWYFEYAGGETTVIVYFLLDQEGEPGPFAVYGVAECDPLAEIE